MFVPIFYGEVKNGRLVLEKRGEFEKYLSSLKGEVQITVSKRKKPRSLAQNAYYWGVLIKMVSEAIGVIPDEAHALLGSLFLKVGVQASGKRYEVVRSTTSLSTREFEEYTAHCRNWAGLELGIYIPEPNEIAPE
jgi:hypothetical protein